MAGAAPGADNDVGAVVAAVEHAALARLKPHLRQKEAQMRIQPVPFGLAFGIVYAVVFFLYGIVAALSGWGAAFAEMLGGFYPGFGPTLGGALIGAIWGFVVGFVFFALGAWLYNMLA